MGIENPVHLIFIAAIALIVLGPKRLPDLAKALGQGIREFREAMSDGHEEAHLASPEEPTAAATAQGPPPAPAEPAQPAGSASVPGDPAGTAPGPSAAAEAFGEGGSQS